jgi:hypothetical protein
MKVKKDYYMGIEEDLSVGTLIVFFLVGISIITAATVVLLNL